MTGSSAAPSVESYRQRAASPERIQGGSRPRNQNAGVPLVSVVSTCRNAEAVLERCIESVVAQDYPNIEFIIFDAASTDGTLALLQKHDRHITFWASERDQGRADGFNKAVAHGTGEYLTAAMADDWLEPDFISNSIAALQRHGTDYVFGDCMLHALDGAPLYRRVGDPDFARKLRYWMTINSPSFVIRRTMLDELGLFSDISVASDYDWFLRAHLAGYRGAYDPSILCHFRIGGVSTTSAFKAYRENFVIARKYGAPAVPAMGAFTGVLLRYYSRLALQALLPDNVMLALRRYRQSRRVVPQQDSSAPRT